MRLSFSLIVTVGLSQKERTRPALLDDIACMMTMFILKLSMKLFFLSILLYFIEIVVNVNTPHPR